MAKLIVDLNPYEEQFLKQVSNSFKKRSLHFTSKQSKLKFCLLQAKIFFDFLDKHDIFDIQQLDNLIETNKKNMVFNNFKNESLR